MDSIKDVYIEFATQKCFHMCDFVQFLVEEKEVVRWEDPAQDLKFYAQPKFQKKMATHIEAYKKSKRRIS